MHYSMIEDGMNNSKLKKKLLQIRFGKALYSQIVSIPVATKYAPLIADLFL